MLLAAGGVALEREEHALARLLRGPGLPRGAAGREGAAGRRLLLRLAFAMLAGIGAFVQLDWSRVGLWLVALAFGAVAFGALGVAIGALAREVRAASLLAFLLSLPLAFLALVPAGSVARGLYDAIGSISFVFPFKAALQALDAAVNGASPRSALAGASRRAHAGVRGARARGAAARRVSARRRAARRPAEKALTWKGDGLSTDAHAQAARQRRLCAGWCARPS